MKTYTILIVLLFATQIFADESYIYPADGQTAEQQQKDEFECYQWAVNQSGFDPTKPVDVSATPSSSQSTQGGAAKSALGGAAKGAVIAETSDGDAEKGAATGAALGLMRNQRKQKQEAAAAQEQAKREALERERKLRTDYARANAACLEGRAYTVK